jgi:hypothetical protein
MMLAKRTQKNFAKSFAKIRQFKIKVVPLHPLRQRTNSKQNDVCEKKRTQKNFTKSFAKIRQFKIKVVPLHPLS